MSERYFESEYVKNEFAKWQEMYEIPYKQEFLVKSLLSLQKQFISEPEDHVMAKERLLN
jgi:hypothetical protein